MTSPGAKDLPKAPPGWTVRKMTAEEYKAEYPGKILQGDVLVYEIEGPHCEGK